MNSTGTLDIDKFILFFNVKICRIKKVAKSLIHVTAYLRTNVTCKLRKLIICYNFLKYNIQLYFLLALNFH